LSFRFIYYAGAGVAEGYYRRNSRRQLPLAAARPLALVFVRAARHYLFRIRASSIMDVFFSSLLLFSVFRLLHDILRQIGIRLQAEPPLAAAILPLHILRITFASFSPPSFSLQL